MTWMYAIDKNGCTIEWKGDSGPMSIAFWESTIEECEKNNIEYDEPVSDYTSVIAYKNNAKPRVGACMRVGSPYSRSYSNQDYWTTTPVTEILEEFTDDQNRLNVKFKTRNSTYWWKS